MHSWWVFFERRPGEWLWEQHRQGVSPRLPEVPWFPGFVECRRDAMRHGYTPGLDPSILPPDLPAGRFLIGPRRG